MYSYIKGKVVYIDKNTVVIDNNNIGYNISMPLSDILKLTENKEVQIFTYLNVKEDEMSLYGFLDKKQLKVFKNLLSVSGVGPKVAKNIISDTTPEGLCIAIATADTKALTKISGVGNKMAQRIILELKDKISKEENLLKVSKSLQELEEAKVALQVLGYTTKEIDSMLNNVDLEGKKVEEIIKIALKNIKREV